MLYIDLQTLEREGESLYRIINILRNRRGDIICRVVLRMNSK